MILKNQSAVKGILSWALAIVCCIAHGQQLAKGTINRKAVVQRHNLYITNTKEQGPTQVGNGNFAYGFDITGMQTFNEQFTTMSHWSWHSTAPPQGAIATSLVKTVVGTNGRQVPYELPNQQQRELSQWLTANPHRFNLARIGLWIKKKDATLATIDDIEDACQQLDLWSGVAVSSFRMQGQPVKVTTVSDPDRDVIAFQIESPLIDAGRLGVFIDFPYASLDGFSNGSDYNHPRLHTTILAALQEKKIVFARTMDSTKYKVQLAWTGTTKIKEEKPHRYRLLAQGGNKVEYVFDFCPDGGRARSNSGAFSGWGGEGPKVSRQVADIKKNPLDHSSIYKNLPSFSRVKARSVIYWPSFWNTGGCIDLSESKDLRWKELERRVVLSQYIMKINASGYYPPQETGLVNNSWYGRFHYEMILWNSAHFALWNRWSLLDNSIHVFSDNLESASNRAAEQGYEGARFAKCTGPDGREWPHPIHAFLVWQQPHPIFFADLDYRAHPVKATLDKWIPVIKASADFLASYAHFDSLKRHYVLGTPISFVPENNDYYKDKNPAFELGYWRYALRTAQWLTKKAGLPANTQWIRVANELSPIPVKAGLYEQWEGVDSMWTRFNFEHPALLGIYGLLPGDGVDTTIMKRTFKKVLTTWRFNSTWGWDFPLIAMCAARLGFTSDAINMLLYNDPKNGFDGHGFVGGGNPYPYMPANGGLLYAIAMMTAGWDGDDQISAPGFPKDGSWVVKWEDLQKAP